MQTKTELMTLDIKRKKLVAKNEKKINSLLSKRESLFCIINLEGKDDDDDLGDDDTTMGMFRWAIKVFQGRQYIGRGFMRNSEESKTL